METVNLGRGRWDGRSRTHNLGKIVDNVNQDKVAFGQQLMSPKATGDIAYASIPICSHSGTTLGVHEARPPPVPLHDTTPYAQMRRIG